MSMLHWQPNDTKSPDDSNCQGFCSIYNPKDYSATSFAFALKFTKSSSMKFFT